MYKFEKNANYKIGKPHKDSMNDAIVWQGTPFSAPTEILLTQCDGTFEDWVINANHKFKQGTLLICAKMEDGVPVYKTEMTVPKKTETYNDDGGLSDGDSLDFFREYQNQGHRYNYRQQENENNRIAEVYERQLEFLRSENERLKAENQKLKETQESGLSDSILNKANLETQKELSAYKINDMQSKLDALSQRVKELEKENKGLSDQVIPAQQQQLLQTIAGIIPHVPAIWQTMTGKGQAQAPQMMQGQVPQQQAQTINDSDIDGVPA
jgi:hypothetical protein